MLIANPMAMKVAIKDARPALISGRGTPITGEIPSAIPMLIKIWNAKPPTTAMMNKILHAPMSHLKLNSKDEDEKTLYIAALKKLFDLER